MAARDDYHYEGQYELNGVTYDGSIHQSDLDYIRDDLEFRPSDIVVATYPKAGTYLCHMYLCDLPGSWYEPK